MHLVRNLIYHWITFITIQAHKFSEFLLEIIDKHISVECHQPYMYIMWQLLYHFQQSLLQSF